MTDPHADLTARLETLERAHRRLKRGIAAAVLAIVAVIGVAGQAPKQADPLKVTHGKDGPNITWTNEAGQARMALRSTREGFALLLLDPTTGRIVSGMSLENRGVAFLTFDEAGRPLAGPPAIKNTVGFVLPVLEKR